MRISVLTAIFPAPPETVWDIVTDYNNAAWRSDVTDSYSMKGSNLFVEISKNGMETTFRITKKEPYRFYAFTLENNMICGDWTGEFSAVQGGAKVVFTERVRMRRGLLGFLAYLMPLKAMQKRYVQDLRNYLEQQI